MEVPPGAFAVTPLYENCDIGVSSVPFFLIQCLLTSRPVQTCIALLAAVTVREIPSQPTSYTLYSLDSKSPPKSKPPSQVSPPCIMHF